MMAAYALIPLFVGWVIHRFHPSGALLYGLAALPATAIVVAIVCSGIYIAEETDEYQRNLFVQSILWGVAGILVITSVWGWFQIYTQICNVPLVWIFPFFLCCQFIALAALKWRRR
jgi:hypothetical protein